ncbi:MAG TPA: hypothetical protein VEJ86_02600, partial [Candidatus Binataceae bacterium]|nr:hypothetical protein [Candidatus Binataceae bacterium]
ENQLLADGRELDSTVLKVPHHGSATSSSLGFVEAVHPEFAVISDGYLNRFDFPAPEVVSRYQHSGALILRTDHDGAVAARTDGNTLNLRSFRSQISTTVHP